MAIRLSRHHASKLRLTIARLTEDKAEVVLIDIYGGRELVVLDGSRNRLVRFFPVNKIVPGHRVSMSLDYVAEIHPL